LDEMLEGIYNAVINGDSDVVKQTIRTSLDKNIPAKKILDDALIPAMTRVGSLFEQGEYFIPEMLVSAISMKEGLEILKPLLINEQVKAKGRVVIGSVQGDLHDIGKNLVAMLLEGAGFEVKDLGVNVSPEKFVSTVREVEADILALSALLTTTMASMKNTIEALAAAGIRDKVKVMVGGAPVTGVFAESIGADGYAADASQAAVLARSWI
jgi:5-methyltetrahydrofolate--homocysteine methyltransferase